MICPSFGTSPGVGGINALDLLLSRVEGFQVTNGYLKFLAAKPSEEAQPLVADVGMVVARLLAA